MHERTEGKKFENARGRGCEFLAKEGNR